jgi:hypothetical protein
MPDASAHPQPRTQSKKAREQVTTGTPKQSGIPRAMVFTGSFVLFLVIGLSCHHRQRNHSANLISASRYRNHTTSPSACSRIRLCVSPRPSHPAPTFRDDREAPLLIGHGMARGYRDDLPDGQSEIFLRAGVDSRIGVD